MSSTTKKSDPATVSDHGPILDKKEEQPALEKASSEVVLTGEERDEKENEKLTKKTTKDVKDVGKDAAKKPQEKAPAVTPPSIKKKPGQTTTGPGESTVEVPIWFVTNRKLADTGEYTKARDPLNNTYGRMDVSVEVAQNHNPSKKQGKNFTFASKTEDVFFKEVNDRLEVFRKLGCKPQVLVALHNYNVGFMDSLLLASHWQEDLNVPGAVITYSWPSIGKSGNYEPDYAGIERSEPEILDFLLKVSAMCGAENVHFLADGMACLGLVRVLQRLAADQVELKLGQMFLLAPDVDRELFMDLSWLFPKFTTRTTLYASDCDADATRSVKRHAAPRAGVFEPYTIVDGVDTIAISGFETDDFMVEKNTRKYEIVTLFYDMYDLMKSDAPPSRRLHLTKMADHGKTYWKLRKLH